jgi:DNA invertase Pin-like site-specific DNA recombinase
VHSQIDVLTAAWAERIFTDKVIGKNATRPGLAACIDYLPASAALVVHSTDRLRRSMTDLVTIGRELNSRSIQFRSLLKHCRWPADPDKDGHRDVAAPDSCTWAAQRGH